MGQNRSKYGIIGQNDSSPKTVPKQSKNRHLKHQNLSTGDDFINGS